MTKNIANADHDFQSAFYDDGVNRLPLGMQRLEVNTKGPKLMITAFLPEAIAVDVISLKDNRKVASLNRINDQGLFSGPLGRRSKPFLYQLRIKYPLCVEHIIDPYQFNSLLSKTDVYLFSEGCQHQAERFLGANWRVQQGVKGVLFCLWAPNAQRVALVGDFNHWDPQRHPMRRHESSGLWELFVPNASEGQYYKFEILTQDQQRLLKSDPFAKQIEPLPGHAAMIPTAQSYQWQDGAWLTQREKQQWHQAAMSIYEVHLASWRRKQGAGSPYLNYQDLIEQLIPYVKEMNFTHLQLMPISEYPLDDSWGYQPVGMYAPSHRFGDPNGLKQFIDACHQAGIAVLFDWVAAHFPKDPHGLARFDGSCLFEHEDPLKGEHPDWGTLIYNYDRAEVKSYLLSNACYWLREFHFDGLRIDAVSSMLYLDYSREPGQWQPNEWGGNENVEAIHFLRRLNQVAYQDFPGIVMIAEESTSWAGVTQATESHTMALGFGFKWNMGWMHDTLDYLQRDPIHRQYHHNEMTFGLVYAFDEQFILPLSHDEVVYGKRSLLHKIPGDDWQKFATLRSYYGFMWGHPGKKLLFMGGEFGQRDEWDHSKALDWSLLAYPLHQGLQAWVKDLNQLYLSSGVLFENDHNSASFSWLDCDNASDSTLVFIRYGNTPERHLIFVVNMLPDVKYQYRIGLPRNCAYREVLNSDSSYYGGSNQGNKGQIQADGEAYQGMAHSGLVTVPPLACLILAPMDLMP